MRMMGAGVGPQDPPQRPCGAQPGLGAKAGVSYNFSPSLDSSLLKMKPIIHRRRSTPTAISRALSKSKHHSSRDMVLCPSQPDNGLSAAGAFGRPSSLFLLDERVQMSQGLQTQERHLFLFDDRLVVAKSKSPSSLKLKKQVPLGEIWTGACLGDVSEKRLSPEASFVLGWPTNNWVATFSSPEVKEKWLSTLLWHVEVAKQAESPKCLPMQVFLMDGENSSATVSVPVSNMEVADDVVKKAAQQLGLPGRASDYRLCVLSGRDSPAFSLLGHEYPFSIILSGLRGSLDHVQGTNNNHLLPGSEASILDQIPKEKQCQFVLKPRPNAHVQLRREPLQKHSKRKKSLIDWALRRSSSTPTSSPASQSPPNPRKLFGLSLSSVCPGGRLPKPIMDILQLLYLEGPSTRGIFRRSANAKTCKELKERLNSGDDVQVDGESVFVAAAVITDFLRNIPDSVLSSDMHGLWMEAMDKENWEHRIEAIQSLVNQLPEANRILLRHLFGVLHRIEQNASENQMTAFNLALCIAPNMLWLPSPTGPEEESKSTKKVAFLVQFLIENSAEIFGRDITSLFQRPERKKSKSVDDILAQRIDSSDEMEFAASFGERSNPRYRLEVEDGLFGPSLSEEREDWDLFSEIAACYRSKAGKNASADSYDLLEQEEEGGSFCSLGSVCSLDAARNRCSSEPSVCLSSRLPSQEHEPVARQSSCDAAIMHSHGDYIRRLQKLQLESQKLLNEGLSPGLSRAAGPGFWRPSLGGNAPKRPGPQKASLSNRSSFSSLSSTTSPSASSLSSLDSAFSYCSESSSAFSPTDTASSLPFMFGTSARLHALSPKVAERSSKEWHKPLTSPLPLSDVEFSFEGREDNGREEVTVFLPIGSSSGSLEDIKSKAEEEESRAETLSCPLTNCSHVKTEYRTAIPSPESNFVTSMKHIEIKGSKDAAFSQGSLKRTKITVYMAPKERSPRESPVVPDEGYVVPDPSTTKTVRVHIPQTVFYGQNTPLVLQSVSRRYHHESSSPPTRAEEPEPLGGPDVGCSQEVSKTFSHTFRIFLPASVRHTVREYFSRDGPEEHRAASVDTVEEELLRSRAGWLRSPPCADQGPETLIFAEETFV